MTDKTNSKGLEFQTRINVLHASLSMEKFVSFILGKLLNIDIDKSKTLGHKTSSLSFKNKIDLITDVKAMESTDTGKFVLFGEIRNKFLHNLEIDTFEKCFKYLDGKENGFKNSYSPTDTTGLSNELILEKCFENFCVELMKILHTIFGDIIKKSYNQGIEVGKKEISDLIIESLIELRDESPNGMISYEEIIRRTEEKSKKL